jgi:hypothetical protein
VLQEDVLSGAVDRSESNSVVIATPLVNTASAYGEQELTTVRLHIMH